MVRHWNKRKGSDRSKLRKKTRKNHATRRLQSETLESRTLLAGDLMHNAQLPEDVNNDTFVSAVDVLAVVNEVNRRTLRPDAQPGGGFTDVNNDGSSSPLDALMIINRINRDNELRRRPPNEAEQPDRDRREDPPVERPDRTDEVEQGTQAIDGSGNNVENPSLGVAETPLLRIADNDYADGISEPAGEDRPSARVISNELSAVGEEASTSERNLTSFVSIWGQFLDHDIDLSLEPVTEADKTEFNIEVPTGDALFDPLATGDVEISLTRSGFADGTGTSIDNPAEQVNSITAWIDGSQVYGSDQATADSLREFVGGRMLISESGLVPTDEAGDLLAGDIRAAENLALTSMHALFLREHNRLAGEIESRNPELSDEEIYQQARRLVIAELQSITVNEFLPALLGENALSEYSGYDSSIDPTIANEFSTAAFRFGHSTLNDEVRLVGNDGEDLEEPISLANAFFNPSALEETGIEALLKYGSSTLSQEVDLEVVDSLRNFLFGPPGAGGFDLVALNIQRGRDHGLADFNSTREAYGLEAYDSIDQITNDVDLQEKLESLYGDVNNIDLWVGILAEDHTQGSSLGETAGTIIADQFERLRDGDRFWYENTLDQRQIFQVENTSLADIIERNTELDSLQSNVFFFNPIVAGSVLAAQVDQSGELAGQGAIAGEGEPGEGQLGQRRGLPDGGGADRNRDDRGDRQEAVVAGVTVELLDSDGVVIGTAVTDDNGRYMFDSIDQSGAYEVRLADSDDVTAVGAGSWSLAISNGTERMRDIDFRVLT